jgi:solute carrier family 27 fatty acid transporter 1/4
VRGELESGGTALLSASAACPLAGVPRLPGLLAHLPTAAPPSTTGYNDPLMYIYTSGTTGLPKAAVLKHSRFLFAVYALFTMTLLSEKDVLYSPLPMYHTAAGAMVTGNCM